MNNICDKDSEALGIPKLIFDKRCKLKRLELTGNCSAPQVLQVILERSGFHRLRNLQFLDLSHNNLSSLAGPDRRKMIRLPKSLIDLKMDGNSLNTLPDDFSKLTHLERFSFDPKYLQIKPKQVAALRTMRLSVWKSLWPCCDFVISHEFSLATGVFGKIPQEVFLHILSYIPKRQLCKNIAFVSRQFHTMAIDPCLWQTLDSSLIKLTGDLKEHFRMITAHHPGLTKLDLTQPAVGMENQPNNLIMYWMTLPAWNFIPQRCTNLRILHLSITNAIPQSILLSLAKSPVTQTLTTLKIQGGNNAKIKNVMRDVFSFPNLETLALNFGNTAMESYRKYVPRAVGKVQLKKLRMLDFSECVMMPDYFLTFTLKTLTEKFGADGICGLKMKGCAVLEEDAMVGGVCKYLEKLEVLDIADCQNAEDGLPDTLLRFANTLADLDMSFIEPIRKEVPDSKILNMAAACARLRRLKITVKSETDFISALSQVDGMKLEMLDVRSLALRNNVAGSKAMAGLVQKSAGTLVELTMHDWYTTGCVDAGDLMRVISKKCTKLRVLCLYMQSLKDDDISTLFVRRKKNNLRDHLEVLDVFGSDLSLTGFSKLWSEEDVLPFYGLKELTIESCINTSSAEQNMFIASLKSAFKDGRTRFTLPSLLRVTFGKPPELQTLTQFSRTGYYQPEEKKGRMVIKIGFFDLLTPYVG
eukprot:TRINITY_DN944_c0_g6_i1.p1 TRINITY_DN944_c0_g6~~TRINITY_DN944_c0_g6_i1.p1  ORF type:complete len:698 (-),score=104.12 TRINITY_DN944_c0_g6_i1:75-2168(-)